MNAFRPAEMLAARRRILEGIDPPGLRAPLERFLTGSISAPVALMQCLLETRDAGRVEGALSAILGTGNGGTAESRRDLASLEALRRDLRDNLAGCTRIASMLAADVDTDAPAASVEAGLAFCKRLFDWSIAQDVDASVALYSLGNPEILKAATAEVVAYLRRRGVLGPGRALLEIGCGTGRFLSALAPLVAEIHGIDVSPRMVAEARRRCAGLGNAFPSECPGRDLRRFPDARFDLVFAVDVFPYLVQTGMALVETHFRETARVLRGGGDFVILNFSYREDAAADREDVLRMAAGDGFELLQAEDRAFNLWDGSAFHLRRQAGQRSNSLR